MSKIGVVLVSNTAGEVLPLWHRAIHYIVFVIISFLSSALYAGTTARIGTASIKSILSSTPVVSSEERLQLRVKWLVGAVHEFRIQKLTGAIGKVHLMLPSSSEYSEPSCNH